MRKHLYLFYLAFLFGSWSMNAQEPDKPAKFTFSGGIGFFGDVYQIFSPGFGDIPDWAGVNPAVEGKIEPGKIVWLDGSYRLSTGFDVHLWCGFAQTSSWQNDPLGLYWDAKRYNNYQQYGLTLSRNLLPTNLRISVAPAVGLICRNYYITDIIYNVTREMVDGVETLNYSYPKSDERHMTDVGLSLGCDVMYRVGNKCEIGCKIFTYFLFDYSAVPEAVSISPCIRIPF